MYRSLIYIFILALATGMACRLSVGEAEPSATPVPADSLISVYFTDPTHPNSGSLRGGPDARLAQAIREAQSSVEVAVLQLDLWSIRDALLDAHDRGLSVRIVVESDYRDSPELEALEEAGIRVIGDRREGLMHNKFTIIDGKEVWTGSMNYTITDGYRNNNNLVRIRSSDLAASYLAEFNEMYEEDRFGPGSPANTPFPTVQVGAASLRVCFAPDDNCLETLVDRVAAARQSIHFLAFSFTADALADAMIDRVRAGASAAGVMEASQVQSNSGTEFERFRNAGIDVRRDGNPRNMHHKVIILDRQFVVTGSYNFSYFGENRNDENLLVIDDPHIAALFETEFERIFQQAQP